MKSGTKHKCLIIPIICLLLTSTTVCAAHDINEWRRRTALIAADSTLTHPEKVIRLSDLTYNYFYYYRTFDQQYIDEYLKLAEQFVGNEHQNDLLSYIYSTAVIISRGKQTAPFKDKCEYYTRRSTNPLIRSQSWERLGRKHITDASGLDYLSRALEAIEGSTEYAALARINGFIGLYYSIQGDTSNQMKYATRSLELAQQSGNARQLMTSWENMAEAYSYLNDYPAAIDAYRQARNIYLKQLKTAEPDADLRYRDDMHYMVTLVNLGSMHYNNGELTKASVYVSEALETATRNHIVETAAYCHKELGRINTELKQYTVAELHLIRAAALLQTEYVSTAESSYIDYEVQLALAHLYGMTGDYRQSAGAYRKGIDKYQQLYDEEQMAVNRQAAAAYETSMQEEAIARMETIITYHERLRLLYAAILVVAIIALFFVARLYRTRIALARHNEAYLRNQARLLKLQNRKAELDNQLKQQEADALRQKLVLGNQLREERNQSLQAVTAFFGRHPGLEAYQNQVKSIMFQQTLIDQNVEEYKQGMADVHPGFYARLQSIADNRLTPLDLKYCRLLYLGTSSKEIAALMSVELKTVRMVKYRLKQKLNLAKEHDLGAFIRTITH